MRSCDADSKATAERRYSAWEKSLPESVKASFSPIVTAWTNWHREILVYFDRPITYAYTESLDNLNRAMSRFGRGYSFEALRATMLFTEGPQKRRLPKFERRNRAAGIPPMRTTMPAAAYRGPTVDEQPDINLGVDIPTLTTMIEEGRFPATYVL
jgi:hypothetical protein